MVLKRPRLDIEEHPERTYGSFSQYRANTINLKNMQVWSKICPITEGILMFIF